MSDAWTKIRTMPWTARLELRRRLAWPARPHPVRVAQRVVGARQEDRRAAHPPAAPRQPHDVATGWRFVPGRGSVTTSEGLRRISRDTPPVSSSGHDSRFGAEQLDGGLRVITRKRQICHTILE